MLLRTHLWSIALLGLFLDLADDLIPAVGSGGKLVLDLLLLGVKFLLLCVLEAFNLLLQFLVVELGLLCLGVLGSCSTSTSELVLNLRFLGVEFLLDSLFLSLDDLLDLLVVALALLLDTVKSIDVALLSIGVPLGCLSDNSLFVGSFIRGLAFSDELYLLVVIFSLLLNVG